MELVLVILTAPTAAAGIAMSPQVVADILWANADPAAGLEHVNVRSGPAPGSHTVGMFLRPGSAESESESEAAARALLVCHRATQTAPALAGWTVAHYRRISAP